MGKPGRDRAPSPVNPGDSATRQEVCYEGPPTRSRWGGYHLARRGGPLGLKSAEYRKRQTSNVKPSWPPSCLARPRMLGPCLVPDGPITPCRYNIHFPSVHFFQLTLRVLFIDQLILQAIW